MSTALTAPKSPTNPSSPYSADKPSSAVSPAWSCFEATVKTLVNTEGATKICKMVKALFRILSELNFNCFEKLGSVVNGFATFGTFIDTFKMASLVFKGQAEDWAQQLSGTLFFTYRFLGALKFLEKVSLIDLQKVTSLIGQIPIFGNIVAAPIEVVGGVSAVFDITHHSMQLDYKIAAEITEYKYAFECVKAQQEWIENDSADLKSTIETDYKNNAKGYLEARIRRGKISYMDDAALSKKIEDTWTKFVSTMDSVKDADDQTDDYIEDKVTFEKRKFEVLHKFSSENESTKRMRSWLAIAYDVSKLLLLFATITFCIAGIAFLSANAPLILALSFLSGVAGVAKISYDVNSKDHAPAPVEPASVETAEKTLKKFKVMPPSEESSAEKTALTKYMNAVEAFRKVVGVHALAPAAA